MIKNSNFNTSQKGRFERKLLISAAFFIFLFGILNGQKEADSAAVNSPIPSSISKISDSQENKIDLEKFEQKIKPGSVWRPEGWGSGEYLEDIPRISAGAVIDFESGEVIWSQNLREKIAPASLTKVLTVMTAMDLVGLDEQLEVKREAAEQIPTKIGLREGEKLKLSEAISAAILTSANDAAELISSAIGKRFGNGTEDFEKFVNFKAKRIGANDSNFVTSTGLDAPDHYSTVYDLAIIGHEALSGYPYIADVADDNYRRLDANSDHKVFDLPNWNALLGTYPGITGLKIGYTENAGHATMVTAERDGKKMLVVLVGADSLENREIAAATLLNYGFEKKGVPAFPIDNLDLVRRFEDWRVQLSMAN